LRVGLIGAGHAAALHLHALQRLRSAEVTGILDCDLPRAAALAARFALPPEVATADRFYDFGRPHIVHIVTPPASHYPLALDALNRGVHVLVEKPPALTTQQCDALWECAAARGVTIGVNENTAFDPLVRRAAAAIAAGEVGRLLHVDGEFSFGLDPDDIPAPWVAELPGGMLEDLLPHLLVTARALAGARMASDFWRLGSGGGLAHHRHDTLRLILVSESGVTVGLTLSLAGRPKTFRLAAQGTRGAIQIDLSNMLYQLSRTGAGDGALARGFAVTAGAFGDLVQTGRNALALAAGRRERFGGMLPLIRAHHAALAAGAPVPAPLSRAIETVRIVQAIWPRVDATAAAGGAGNR